MKTSILKAVAALAMACLLLNFAPTLLNTASAAWSNIDSLSMRHNFYFGKRQWLADARTVVAAVRYLYQSSAINPSNAVNVIKIPVWPVNRHEASTNLLVTNGNEFTGSGGSELSHSNSPALWL